MKTITLLLTSLFVAQSFAQTTLLQQDFNGGMPAGWQLINNDNLVPYNDPSVNFITDAYVITEDNDSIGMGDNVLVATSWHENIGEADDYLILPKLTMGSIGNYISFDAKSLDASHPDGLEIRISRGGVNVWEFYNDEPAYDNPAVNPYWTNYVVSLDSISVANDDIFITFRHTGNDQFILAIDNIKVWIEDPVSITENNTGSINIFPNPSSSSISMNIPNNTPFQIIDIAGKVIVTDNYTGSINVSDFSNGIYFIKAKGYQVEKLVKN